MVRRSIVYAIIALAAASILPSCYKADPVPEKPYEANMKLSAEGHPRVIINGEDLELIRTSMGSNPYVKKFSDRIVARADAYLGASELAYVLEGKRLLAVSQDAANRLVALSYAYRMTGDRKYLERAERDITAVCSFPDWNGPNHFLDVGEMCYAVGVAYDWLYSDLSDKCKDLIVSSVRGFAFDCVFKKKYSQNFYESSNNWNQVCTGGLIVAALAIYENCPEDADRIIADGIAGNRAMMESIYGEDGNSREGYGYWNYGTMYEVAMMAALESALGSDRGLSEVPGMRKTGKWMLFMEGMNRRMFSFSDGGIVSVCQTPLWYLAWKFDDPSILYYELMKVEAGMYDTLSQTKDMPLMVLSAARIDVDGVKAPEEKLWAGQGQNPVVLVHGDWTFSDSDKFLGIKAGAGNRSHAHLDMGSFVYDAFGTRWSADMGSQDYYAAETYFAPNSIWNYDQNSVRWKMFRYNNYNHSTITVNDLLYNPQIMVPLTEVIDTPDRKGGVIDMTPCLRGAVQKATRTITLEGDNLVVKDEINTYGNIDAKVRWNMVTTAVPEVQEGFILLRGAKKNMKLSVSGNAAEVSYKTWSTRGEEYDADNTGYYEAGFEVTVPAGKKDTFTTVLQPL